ncbi:MAG: HAD family hydrolase [Muribaculaceae bacterium]|nr:HAD family hydrolase [Muribaculaceae bacterium]
MTQRAQKTLYVSDLDGTLLNTESQVSHNSAQGLNRLIEEGALFTIATARTPATVVPLLHDLNMSLPYIVLNGAALWNHGKSDYERVHVLDPATVKQVCKVFESCGLHPFVYRREGHMVYAHHVGSLSKQEKIFVQERLNLPLKQFFLEDEHYYHHPDVMLIYSMQDYGKLRRVFETLQTDVDCSPFLYHDIYDFESGLIEVYRSGVSKAQAIKSLAKQCGATRIVVFGDNRNDIPMMQAATLAVATENAFPEVKAVAHEVIGDNDSDSVMHWIEQDFYGQRKQ